MKHVACVASAVTFGLIAGMIQGHILENKANARGTSTSDRIIGEIVYLGAQHPPVGWLPCDGRTYYVAQYPKLGRVLGSKFGGDGRYRFGVPKAQIADGTAVIDGMIAYEGQMPSMRRIPQLPVYRIPKK